LTVHIGGQNPKAVALQNAHMAVFFLTKATYCRRKFETNNNGNPNYGREVVGVHGQRGGLWPWPLEALYYARLKAPISIFLLIIFNPFLWTLNKVWPFKPTSS
jgi:hypothetical protein